TESVPGPHRRDDRMGRRKRHANAIGWQAPPVLGQSTTNAHQRARTAFALHETLPGELVEQNLTTLGEWMVCWYRQDDLVLGDRIVAQPVTRQACADKADVPSSVEQIVHDTLRIGRGDYRLHLWVAGGEL